MEIRIKKLDDKAVIPYYNKSDDAGMDLIAISRSWDSIHEFFEYDTAIAVEIPYGFVGLIYPRSSISKYDLTLCNHVGVIDSSYRGSIKLRFKTTFDKGRIYEIGDKVAQLMIIPYPRINWIESNELTNTERGSSGFGSSGN